MEREREGGWEVGVACEWLMAVLNNSISRTFKSKAEISQCILSARHVILLHQFSTNKKMVKNVIERPYARQQHRVEWIKRRKETTRKKHNENLSEHTETYVFLLS